jgi:predicted O-methyltransferase YrrM
MELRTEYHLSNKDCLLPERWHVHPEDGGTGPNGKICTCEMEVLEFLESLVLMLKPRLMVELGVNAGIAAEHFLQALPENSRYIGVESDREMFDIATTRLQGTKACLLHMTAVEAAKNTPTGDVDFLFVDTGAESRIGDLEAWEKHLSPFSVVAVHDTDTERPIRDEVDAFCTWNRWMYIHLPTPRSLSLMRRVTNGVSI